MSTRIYNGFRFRTSDFGEIDAALRRFREELAPLHLRELARLYGDLALRRIDGEAALALRPSAPRPEESRTGQAREWEKLVQATRDYVDRFGPPGADTVAERAAAALAMRGSFDPDGAAPAVPSAAALAFLEEAASMDPGLLPALEAARDRPMSAAWAQVADRQRQIERTHYRDAQVDFEFDVDLFSHGGRFYGMVRSERAAWVRMWMSKPEIEEFGYWDASDDRPDGVSARAWAARRRAWDAIMPTGVPARSCWTASLMDGRRGLGREELDLVLSALPTFAERVDRVARRVCFDDRVRAVAGDPASVPMDVAVHLAHEIPKWMRQPEGRAALGGVRAEVAALLKPDLTVDDLLDGVAAAGPAAAPTGPG